MSASAHPALALRAVDPADHPAVLALNRAGEPGVGPIERAGLAALLAAADFAQVAVEDDRIVGAVVALLPGSPYASPNYRWFEARGGRFLYVDRVMVAADRQGRGVGRALHAAVADAARRLDAGEVVCEVNEVPANPISFAFHEALGFRRLAGATDPRDGKRVAMMARPLR